MAGHVGVCPGIQSLGFGVLRPGGLLVTIVERMDAALKQTTEAHGRRFGGVTVEPDHQGLDALAGLVERSRLRVHVGRTFALSDAPAAHAMVEAGGLTGKVALVV